MWFEWLMAKSVQSAEKGIKNLKENGVWPYTWSLVSRPSPEDNARHTWTTSNHFTLHAAMPHGWLSFFIGPMYSMSFFISSECCVDRLSIASSEDRQAQLFLISLVAFRKVKTRVEAPLSFMSSCSFCSSIFNALLKDCLLPLDGRLGKGIRWLESRNFGFGCSLNLDPPPPPPLPFAYFL